MNPGKVQTFEVYQCKRGTPTPTKRRTDVTLEDITHLDSLSVTADDPFAMSAAKYVSSIFDITSFKPMKPLSRRDDRPVKRTNEVRRRARGRRLPFRAPPRATADFPVGETITLQRHSILDLEQDYFKSLMDENGKFRKYAPSMECVTDVLAVEFRVQLADGRIWRTLRMEASTSFYLLRRAILDLMSWSESTSWTFLYVNRSNQVTLIGQSGPLKSDEEIRNDEQFIVIETLHENYCKFAFIYDLVTQWKVDLFLRKVVDRDESEQLPVCIRGRGVINLARIECPQRLVKVCDVLRAESHPKRGKYLDKYGDLMASVHVADTPFPSFYDRPSDIVVMVPTPVRRRRKRGPFLVKWTAYPKPQTSEAPPLKPEDRLELTEEPPVKPMPRRPVFGIKFVEYPPIVMQEVKQVAVEMKETEEQGRTQSPEAQVTIEKASSDQEAEVSKPSRKRRRKPVHVFDPKPPEKRKRRARSDGVLVINFDVEPQPEEEQSAS